MPGLRYLSPFSREDILNGSVRLDGGLLEIQILKRLGFPLGPLCQGELIEVRVHTNGEGTGKWRGLRGCA